jgi:hypothetical protein
VCKQARLRNEKHLCLHSINVMNRQTTRLRVGNSADFFAGESSARQIRSAALDRSICHCEPPTLYVRQHRDKAI